MSIILTATFGTRREAEMTIERLVQEFGIDRAAVSVSTEGDENSVGEQRAGSDNAAGQPGQDDRADAALSGSIVVTAEVPDEAAAEKVRDAFGEFDAEGVVETEDRPMRPSRELAEGGLPPQGRSRVAGEQLGHIVV